jgi:hypothetical protein
MQMWKNSFFILLASSLLAILGSMAKEVSKLEQKKFSKLTFVSAAIVATFSGLVIGLICLNYDLSPYLTVALSGLAGYSGEVGLNLILTTIRKKTGIETEKKN